MGHISKMGAWIQLHPLIWTCAHYNVPLFLCLVSGCSVSTVSFKKIYKKPSLFDSITLVTSVFTPHKAHPQVRPLSKSSLCPALEPHTLFISIITHLALQFLPSTLDGALSRSSLHSALTSHTLICVMPALPSSSTLQL